MSKTFICKYLSENMYFHWDIYKLADHIEFYQFQEKKRQFFGKYLIPIRGCFNAIALFTYKIEHQYYVLESLYTHQLLRMPDPQNADP